MMGEYEDELWLACVTHPCGRCHHAGDCYCYDCYCDTYLPEGECECEPHDKKEE